MKVDQNPEYQKIEEQFLANKEINQILFIRNIEYKLTFNTNLKSKIIQEHLLSRAVLSINNK